MMCDDKRSPERMSRNDRGEEVTPVPDRALETTQTSHDVPSDTIQRYVNGQTAAKAGGSENRVRPDVTVRVVDSSQQASTRPVTSVTMRAYGNAGETVLVDAEGYQRARELGRPGVEAGLDLRRDLELLVADTSALPQARNLVVRAVVALVEDGAQTYEDIVAPPAPSGSGGCVPFAPIPFGSGSRRLTLGELANATICLMQTVFRFRNHVIGQGVSERRERQMMEWPLPKKPNAHEAALLAAAWHRRAENGVVYSVYADVTHGGGGTLKWRNVSSGAWEDFVSNLGRGEFGGPLRDDFDALMPDGNAAEFIEFKAAFTREVERGGKIDLKTLRLGSGLSKRWSLVNGGARRLNRFTKELVDVTDDPIELTANSSIIAVHFEDDGAGHAKFPENFMCETFDNHGVKRLFDANRDFFSAMFAPEESEVGEDMVLAVGGYFIGYDSASREAVALIGERGAAKSTLITLFQRMCDGNYAPISWSQLGEPSKLFSLNGKGAILCGEIGEVIRGNTRVIFNKLAAHDAICEHELYVGETQINFCGPNIGASNMFPKTDDRTGAFESRVTVCEFTHSVYDNAYFIPAVLDEFVYYNEFQAWFVGRVIERYQSVRSLKSIGNQLIRRANAKLADEIDWVRQFLDIYFRNLDRNDVDAFFVQTAFSSYKVWYACEVGGKVTGSLNREFKQSFVKYVRERGWIIDLDTRGQYANKRMPKGFYEPRRLRRAVSEWIGPSRYDVSGKPIAYGPAELVKWVDYDVLTGHYGKRDGLLDSPHRGVCVRASAMHEAAVTGVTPEERHAADAMAEHNRALAELTDSARDAYLGFRAKVICSVVDANARDFDGFPYEPPTVAEWEAMGRPTDVVFPSRVVPRNPYGGIGQENDRIRYLNRLTVCARVEVPVAGEDDTQEAWYIGHFTEKDGLDPGPTGPDNNSPAAAGADSMRESTALGVQGSSRVAGALDEASANAMVASPASGPTTTAGTPCTSVDDSKLYAEFARLAGAAVARRGGYVVLDGGVEGATLCNEVISREEWRSYGRPHSDGGEFGQEKLPLIE